MFTSTANGKNIIEELLVFFNCVFKIKFGEMVSVCVHIVLFFFNSSTFQQFHDNIDYRDNFVITIIDIIGRLHFIPFIRPGRDSIVSVIIRGAGAWRHSGQ